MSEENVELTRKAYEAFNRRDADAFVDFCDPEVEFVSLIAESEGQVYRGHDGVREFFRQQDEAFESISAEIEEISEFGDLLIIGLCFRARGRESGSPSSNIRGRPAAYKQAGSCGGGFSAHEPKPLKPPGLRSRRCRGRTSRSCAEPSTRSRRAT